MTKRKNGRTKTCLLPAKEKMCELAAICQEENVHSGKKCDMMDLIFGNAIIGARLRGREQIIAGRIEIDV